METPQEELSLRKRKSWENEELISKFTKKLWEDLFEATKDFEDPRRYIIFSRVTGFLVANVYLPIVSKAVEDALGSAPDSAGDSEGKK